MEQNHKPAKDQFDDNSIKTLEWNEHIQRRPEMYIGRLGDGSDPKDGIYTLLRGGWSWQWMSSKWDSAKVFL
jgi:topoisomerase-4 subunit B